MATTIAEEAPVVEQDAPTSLKEAPAASTTKGERDEPAEETPLLEERAQPKQPKQRAQPMQSSDEEGIGEMIPKKGRVDVVWKNRRIAMQFDNSKDVYVKDIKNKMLTHVGETEPAEWCLTLGSGDNLVELLDGDKVKFVLEYGSTFGLKHHIVPKPKEKKKLADCTVM